MSGNCKERVLYTAKALRDIPNPNITNVSVIKKGYIYTITINITPEGIRVGLANQTFGMGYNSFFYLIQDWADFKHSPTISNTIEGDYLRKAIDMIHKLSPSGTTKEEILERIVNSNLKIK
jgi:hypothetical protein